MALDLANYEQNAREATQAFLQSRTAAKDKQIASGKADQGERAGVIGGQNMNQFAELIIDIVKANGLGHALIHQKRSLLTLPGYFRPTKLWDLLVTHEGQLIVAIELKSHVGPSFSNNFNNRAEEALGTGHDLWTAYREDAFGRQPRPFVGWLMLVEDAPGSNRPPVRKEASPHFPISPEFQNTSYLTRYDILCQRLMKEQLYSVASVIASSRSAAANGQYTDISATTSLKTFITSLAGHVAAEAARLA